MRPQGYRRERRWGNLVGWIGVVLSVVISSLWAYWGIMENFHEGWYAGSIWENLLMLFFQYLFVSVLFVALGLVALHWKRAGLAAHVLFALFCAWFFSGASFQVVGLLIVIPIAGLGVLHYLGNPRPKRLAAWLMPILPLVIILAVSVPMGIRAAHRIDDGDVGARIVTGNGVTLTWAPRGPGWPETGTDWAEAQRICRFLSEDGTSLMTTEQNIWRLPTVDEAVRSMMIHGSNAGGVWDPVARKAAYEKTPDKESPLWDVHAQVIYYWTADTDSGHADRAYIIVYHGGVFTKRKTDGQAYLGFRAVKP